MKKVTQERTSARSLVGGPPRVVLRRCSIHRSFDEPEKGFPILTWAVASPPMSFVNGNLLIEGVINLEEEAEQCEF